MAMFEKAKPPAIPSAGRVSTRSAPISDPVTHGSDEGGAFVEALPLRAIEWSELTARLSAARDLRQLLREDIGAQVGAQDIAFADAAAQFFRTNEDDERCVNPTALEGRKTSSGMYQDVNREGDGNIPFADHDSVNHEGAEPSQVRDGSGAMREKSND